MLGKGWPLGSRLWYLILTLSLSHWYPGSGVVLECIDSWSLPSFLLLILLPSYVFVVHIQVIVIHPFFDNVTVMNKWNGVSYYCIIYRKKLNSWIHLPILRDTGAKGPFISKKSTCLIMCRWIAWKSVSQNGSVPQLSCSSSWYMVLSDICKDHANSAWTFVTDR